jgi:copper resistance protein C
MTPTIPTALRLLTSLVAVTALLVLLAVPAAAHARLVASTPADGATLDAAPTEVVLEFNEPVEAEFGQLQVFDPEGARVDAAAPVSDGAIVRSPLLDATTAGTYTVAYRVISADGHPVEGSFTYDVTPEAVAALEPAPELTPEEVDPPGADDTTASGDAASAPETDEAPETTDATDTTADETAPDTTATAADGAGLPWLPIVLLVVVVLGVAAAVLSRRTDEEDAAADDEVGAVR